MTENAFHIDEAKVARISRRASEAVRSGERQSVVALPEDKAGYPKLLCLDLNKWIDLAKAHYGRPGGDAFKPALESVRTGISEGKLVVPITAANAREVGVPAHEERRRRLAEFMVSLSGNHSLANDSAVILPEMDNAIRRLWRRCPPRHEIRSRLVQRGMVAALAGAALEVRGVDEPVREFLAHAHLDPELSVLMLMHTFTREQIARRHEEASETAQASMRIRGGRPLGTLDEERQLAATSLFRGGRAAEQLRQILAETGQDADSFFEWLFDEDNSVRLAEAIPGIDVMSTLLRSRNENPDQASERNDSEDLSFLRVVLPYANVVAVEKAWGHHVRKSGIADRYGTIVLTHLTALPTILSSELG